MYLLKYCGKASTANCSAAITIENPISTNVMIHDGTSIFAFSGCFEKAEINISIPRKMNITGQNFATYK